MPYIIQARRNDLRISATPQQHGILCNNPGELNFVLTETILGYLQARGLSYLAINDIRGALAGAQAEFERRVAYPYEDTKKEENGDVYP